MFWYYIRDNWKSLLVGGIVGITCITCVLNYINTDFKNKTQQLTPIAEENVENEGGTIYDKYLENNEELKKQNTENIDFNAKPVAVTLNKTINSFNAFMIQPAKELKKESVIMKSGDIDLYELLNGGDYKDMVSLLSDYTSEGTVKQALQLYGYGINKGKVCHQEGENQSAYKVNTLYPIDVVYASDYAAEVIVPLTKNNESPIIYDTEKNPPKDYSQMTTANFSFKKQHGKWLIFNIDINKI